MDTSLLNTAITTVVTTVIAGVILFTIEYRTRWFARRLQPRISDTNPDAEELRSRALYIQRCTELINNAKKHVEIRTNTMSKSGNVPAYAAENQAIRNARHKGVNVRILVGAEYDRLPGAIELIDKFDADVRFDPEISGSDINYICADGSHLVIATRQSSSESENSSSNSWIEFRSTFLASVLSKVFDQRWKDINTRRLGEFMYEKIPVALKSQDINTLSNELGREPTNIEQYIHLKPFIIFIIGRPGSGKTTIARLLNENLPLTGVYLRTSLISDLEHLRKVFSLNDDAGKRFEKTEDGGFFILDATLYDEALVDLSAQVKRGRKNNDLLIVEFARKSYLHALEVFSNQGVQPNLIVYINVDYEIALVRNKLRSIQSTGDRHFVSEKEMRETYAKDDLEELLKLGQFNTMVIDNNQDMIIELDERVISIIEKIKDATK